MLYRRNLRVQPLRELMAVVGLAAGVALLFAVQVSHRSITGSFEQITRGVAGNATIELASRSPEGFDRRIASTVQQIPGVKVAAPVLERPIVAVGPKGRRALTLVGATQKIGELGGDLSLAFQRAANASKGGLLVITEPTANALGARQGVQLTVEIAGRTKHLSVAAVVPNSKLNGSGESPIAATDLPILQVLANARGLLSRVLIEPRRGQERAVLGALRARFGSTLNARSVETEAKLLGDAAGPEKQITLLFSAISLVTGMILAYNALLLASDERRRFMVSLIETGTPESMLLSSLAFDALILGVLGCGLGLLAGDLISLIAYRSIPGYIAAAFAVGGQRIVDTQTVLVALGAGLLAAFIAAALPALVILRGAVLAEPEAIGRALSFTRQKRLSDRAVFVSGALLVLVSALLSAQAPAVTVVALVGMAAGLVLCVPMTTRTLLKLARKMSTHSGDPARLLSIAELRSSSTRPIALLATGTIAAFLTVLIGGSVSDVKHAASRGASDLLSSASLWIKPGGPENVYTTQPFSYTEDQRRLQSLPGVETVLPWRDSFLDLPGRRVWVLGVPPQTQAQIAPSQIVQGSLQEADTRLREGGWAALSETIAREKHLRIGQRFVVPTPTGNATLRLAATIANYGWLPGAIVMNGSEHARLWGSSSATQLAVTLNANTPLGDAKREVQRSLPPTSALSVSTSHERRAEVSAVLGSTLSRLNDTTFIVLIATVTSVLALMLAAVTQRRGRLNRLISIGMDFRQLTRLVFYENGIALLSGCLIGSAVGLLAQYLIDGWLTDTTGASLRYSPAWGLGLRTVAIAGAISLVASVPVVAQTISLQSKGTTQT